MAPSIVEEGTTADDVEKEEVMVKEKEEEKDSAEAGEGVVEKTEGVEEKVEMQVEPKTGVSFPVKLLDHGMQLNAVGVRKKSVLGLSVKIYGFGMYSDNLKLKELLKSKNINAAGKPTKQMYEVAIDGDVKLMVRLVIVFGSLTMSMIKKNFDEGLGASIKKLNGGRKNEELVNKVMGAATDAIKLTTGSVIEISRLPGFVLQTKVKDEIVSTVESELLCRAYLHMYLGDEPFDKEAKERFGVSMLSLI